MDTWIPFQSSSKTPWKPSDPTPSFCCRNVRGPGRKQDVSKVTAGKWWSRGQDSALRSFSALGLPSCQGGNGHEGPQLYVPTTQPTRRAVRVYKPHIAYRRIAVQPNPAGAPSHQSLCRTDTRGWVKPQSTARVTGPITPRGWGKALTPVGLKPELQV